MQQTTYVPFGIIEVLWEKETSALDKEKMTFYTLFKKSGIYALSCSKTSSYFYSTLHRGFKRQIH